MANIAKSLLCLILILFISQVMVLARDFPSSFDDPGNNPATQGPICGSYNYTRCIQPSRRPPLKRCNLKDICYRGPPSMDKQGDANDKAKNKAVKLDEKP